MRIAAERKRRIRRLGTAVTSHIAVVLAIARMEWYFQRRGASFWVMMTLIAVAGVFLATRPQPSGLGTPLWLLLGNPWIQGFLLPILMVALLWRTMHRESRQGTTNLVLTRPVGAGAWVLGKTLGALLAITILYLVMYGVAYAVLSVQQGAMLPRDRNLLALPLFWLVPIAVEVVLFLLLDTLVAVPLLAAIPFLITTVGFYVYTGPLFPGPRAALQFAVFDSGGTLFGTDFDILLGSYLLWLGILSGTGALLMLCYGWRRRRQVPWTGAYSFWVAVLALIAGGAMTPGIVVSNAAMDRLVAFRNSYPNQGMRQAAPPLTVVAVSDYQASISLLPEKSGLRGTVTLTVTSTTGQSDVHAVLQFTHDVGLTVDSVSRGTLRLPLTHQPGLTGVTLSGPLPQTIHLAYHGIVQPIWQGSDGLPPHSFDADLSAPYSSTDQDDAIGPDFTFLTSAGSWYPMPQVQSALQFPPGAYMGIWMAPGDVNWTRLSITVPKQHGMFSSATSIADHGGTTTFVWQHPVRGLLPGALLAICPSCKSLAVSGGRYVAASAIGSDTARRDYAPLVPAYAAVRRIMDGAEAGSSPVTVVAIPALRTSVGGDALVFVPEAPWDGMQPMWQMETRPGEASLTDLQRQRIAISAMAGAWWSGNAYWETDYVWPAPPLYPGSSSPYAVVTAQLAARLVLGDAYFHQEQNLRARYQSRLAGDSGTHYTLVDPATKPAYVREAAALGLLAEYQYFDDWRLTGVIARAGPTRVEALLQMVRQQPILQASGPDTQYASEIKRDYAFLHLPPPKI